MLKPIITDYLNRGEESRDLDHEEFGIKNIEEGLAKFRKQQKEKKVEQEA